MPRGERPTIGLALSGGGLRGLAHIGVLKALEHYRVPIDYIAGTSAGAIAAAMYASGYTPTEMERMAREIEPSELVDFNLTVSDFIKYGLEGVFSEKKRFWSDVPKGFVKGNKIEKCFAKLWEQKTIRDTEIPLAVTAVDIYTADTVFFVTPIALPPPFLYTRYDRTASLTDAVRASIAIPGVFRPKKYRNMMLVDGAVKNNLPTDILRAMGSDIVLGVDLAYDGRPNYGVEVTGEILQQCVDIINREITLLKGAKYADHIFRPPVKAVDYRDIKKALAAIEIGYQTVKQDRNILKKIFRSKKK